MDDSEFGLEPKPSGFGVEHAGLLVEVVAVFEGAADFWTVDVFAAVEVAVCGCGDVAVVFVVTACVGSDFERLEEGIVAEVVEVIGCFSLVDSVPTAAEEEEVVEDDVDARAFTTCTGIEVLDFVCFPTCGVDELDGSPFPLELEVTPISISIFTLFVDPPEGTRDVFALSTVTRSFPVFSLVLEMLEGVVVGAGVGLGIGLNVLLLLAFGSDVPLTFVGVGFVTVTAIVTVAVTVAVVDASEGVGFDFTTDDDDGDDDVFMTAFF